MSSGALAIKGFDVPIVINRPGAAISYVKGRAVVPAVTVINTTASVQQATPDDLLFLDEAIRTNETKKVYSYVEIKTATDQANPIDADQIIYDGYTWRVVGVDKYTMGTLDHWRAFMQKMNVDHN